MFLADRKINPFYYNWRSPHRNRQSGPRSDPATFLRPKAPKAPKALPTFTRSP
ncbi:MULTISPECIES: hypothetical protein [Planktothricoides]|uniref:Uncharacterized protein n=2 Tax=Planktothricoides raciborskii TaxID=132608 RepID=A0AAU8JBU6_9CYAN|nr:MULTISPECIES: hypothetical protein [Planktothricoides]MBD2547342.1 hypothetical protein [Planktothricoides raciborskii FACHB-1370]MBD2585842.1 hypothetical protein [Planktothricoides raciborskii FACHB-1261]